MNSFEQKMKKYYEKKMNRCSFYKDKDKIRSFQNDSRKQVQILCNFIMDFYSDFDETELIKHSLITLEDKVKN